MWFFKKKEAEKAKARPQVSIRMEAIGGQGANTAGKVLAEAAVLGMGFAGNHFSSFGSEKRGSPVRSFVRFSTDGRPIRSASFIQNPDLLLIFHENLIHTHPEVLEGVSDRTELVLNTSKKARDLSFPKDIQLHSLHLVDASAIAQKIGCGLNAVMLGASAQVVPEVDKEILASTLKNYFARRSPQASQKNAEGFESGFRQCRTHRFLDEMSSQEKAAVVLPEMGWENAPAGGLILNPGNSVLKDHSASRKGVAPKFLKEVCFNCGFCDMVCPDYCFVWKTDANGAPDLQGIDYQYCKGCQKCVTVCPVEALVPTREEDISLSERQNKISPEISQLALNSSSWSHPALTLLAEKRSALADSSDGGSDSSDLLDLKSYLRPEFPPKPGSDSESE